MSAGPRLPRGPLGCLLLVAFVAVTGTGRGAVVGGPLPWDRGGSACVLKVPSPAPPGPAPTRTRAASCPQNWLFYRGYCYGYFTERKTWAEAEEECSRYGPMGRLASIHSRGASRVLSQYVTRQGDGDNTWIGLHDEEHTRQWKWSDNSIFNYKHWDKGQPNNNWDKEDCVVLDKVSGFEFWHDYPCYYKFPFLCCHQL